MIQGGCPQGTGTGGPGYVIADEFSPRLRHTRGVISMANAGPNTGGSQFFITHVPCPHLDNKHAVFGRVTSGLEVVDAIRKGDKIVKVTVDRKRNHPYKPVVMGR
jgi:peptidyl-prolyl cis-trans isomerase B (cyclophilin B)